MILHDIFEQREPYQKAIDTLAQRRIEQIEEYIKNLKKAMAKVKEAEQRQAIQDRIAAYEKERVDLTLGRTVHEVEQPQRAPAKGLLKGKDLVTPQQRVAGATPPATSMIGKAKQTLGSFANWLAGRDDTGPTYEAQFKENDPGSAINSAKYVWEQIRRAHDENVDIATIRWMTGGEPITMSRNQLYHTVQRLKAMSRQNRNAFATQTLADRNNFYLWLGSQKKITPRPPLKQPTDPFQPELPLGKPKIGPVQERVQKKKSDDIQAGDVKVARELQKLRAQYPAARSDVEAVARAEIDSSERSQQQLAAIRGANEKQDALLKQLVALDQEQGREINSLDSENNNLEKQLAQVQATNDRLQATIGQMTGTKTSSRTKTTTPQQPASTASADPESLKKVQDLETQISRLQAQPSTPEIEKKIDALQSRINALPAQAAQALNIDQDKKIAMRGPKVQAPAGDLDIKPVKRPVIRTKKATAKPKAAVTQPVPDEFDFLDLEEPVTEHGGGIGPRQHWQSLMQEQGRPPMDTLNYYFPDINAQSDVEAIRAAIREIVNNPELSKTSKQRLLGQVGMMVQRNRALIGREWRQYLDRFSESMQETFAVPGTTVPRKSVIQGYTVFFNPETRTVSVTRGGDSEEAAIEQARIGTVNLKTFRNAAEKLIDRIEDQMISEGIKDTASATAVIACLLTGGSLTGCATAPQQTTAQQVIKTGQDIGRTVQSAKKITRAGVEAEVNQEIKNVMRGISRPEELNHSNILRIWKRIKGQPPVQPEPQAPEYGPAEPVKRPTTEAVKPVTTPEEFKDARDHLLRKIDIDPNPANKQVLRAELRKLESQAESEGWITIQQRFIREDTAALAAEDAILKRIFVKHRDLMMEYGPDKITQAAESVAYNVGDIAHITDEQINEWVGQVEYILGARP